MQLAKLTATTRGVDRTIVLRPDEAVTIGRSSDCDVPLRDSKVSRRHCQLSFAHGQVVVVDLGSSHGIQHRGVRKPLVALAAGDGFHVGSTFVRFETMVEADDATVAAWFGPGGPYERRVPAPGAGPDDAGDELAVDDAPAPPPPPPPQPQPDVAPVVAAPPVPPVPPRAPVDDATVPSPAPARSGWDAYVPADADQPVRLGEPLRRAEDARPRAAAPDKAFAARLAAEAVVFAIHMLLCLALLAGLKLAVGFDVYRALGIGQ